jgi:aminoglycoside 6'-N-acetyltransferase I
MIVRRAMQNDQTEWLRMRTALWPDGSPHDHLREMRDQLNDPARYAVFVAQRDGGDLGGFLEASLRAYADGCDSSPVGYIEGWYVDADLRQQGVGGELVRAAEQWALAQGCTEMASDCDLGNLTSFRAHLALGYQEAERLIHFRRSLTGSAEETSAS